MLWHFLFYPSTLLHRCSYYKTVRKHNLDESEIIEYLKVNIRNHHVLKFAKNITYPSRRKCSAVIRGSKKQNLFISMAVFQQTPTDAISDMYDNDGGIISHPVDRSHIIEPWTVNGHSQNKHKKRNTARTSFIQTVRYKIVHYNINKKPRMLSLTNIWCIRLSQEVPVGKTTSIST